MNEEEGEAFLYSGEEGLIPWNILAPYMKSGKPTSGYSEPVRNPMNRLWHVGMN